MPGNAAAIMLARPGINHAARSFALVGNELRMQPDVGRCRPSPPRPVTPLGNTFDVERSELHVFARDMPAAPAMLSV